VSVTVNGIVALVHGTLWAALVPLPAGDGTITATATARSGTEATATITLTAVGPPPTVILRAEPGSGVAPLAITWRVLSTSPRPLVQFELDPTGSGAFGPPAPALDGTPFVFPDAGLLFPVVRVTDDHGNVHVARTLVQVDDAQATTARFGQLWAGFKGRLIAADPRGALDYLTPGLQPRFAPLFQQLGAELPAVAASLGDLHLIDAVEHLAEAAILRVEDGAPFLYFVYFRRDNRGRWLIQDM
jgi:hypothetical protein